MAGELWGQQSSLRDSLLPIVHQTAYEQDNIELAIDQLEVLINSDDALEADSALYARFNFWTKHHDVAEAILDELVVDHNTNMDYHLSRIDVLEVDGRFEESQELIQEALEIFPEDTRLMYRLAYSSQQQSDIVMTRKVLSDILTIEPQNEKALLLTKELQTQLNTNSVIADYYGIGDLSYYSIAYAKKYSETGTLIGRLSVAQRNETQGYQLSADWYKTLDKTRYIYAHLGYSNTLLYPKIRINGGFYQYLQNNFNAALFLSYMDFRTDQIVVINPSINYDNDELLIGGGVSYVRGNTNSDLSYQVKLRRYANVRNNFIEVAYGTLASEDLNRINNDVDFSRQFISVGGQVGLFKHHSLGANYAIALSANQTNQDQLSIFLRVNF